MSRDTTILFAGGGTGGHLYPAIAIARELAILDPSSRCVFLCSSRPLDKRILDAAGVESAAIPAAPPSLAPKRLLRFVLSWGPSLRAARRVISRERDERGAEPVVVAMGGFVAAPCVQAARAEHARVALINLDAIPGKANRWIAGRAELCLAVAGADRLPRATAVRPIVRREAMPPGPAAQCRSLLGLDPARPTLLVTGGSQGASSMNNLMIALAQHHARAFSGWQVFHQAGEGAADEVRAAYSTSGISARVVDFCDQMGVAWGAADLVLSRCGAGAVAEVWASATPALLLPYPYHRDQHQRANAQPLAECGGAIVETDLIDPDQNRQRAGRTLLSLMSDPQRLADMRRRLQSLGPADGARQAADRLLDWARPRC